MQSRAWRIAGNENDAKTQKNILGTIWVSHCNAAQPAARRASNTISVNDVDVYIPQRNKPYSMAANEKSQHSKNTSAIRHKTTHNKQTKTTAQQNSENP